MARSTEHEPEHPCRPEAGVGDGAQCPWVAPLFLFLPALVLFFLVGCGAPEAGESDAEASAPEVPAPTAAHEEHDQATGEAPQELEGLGTVSFPTSCASRVDDAMQRGVALLHSFYFSAARDAFDAAASEDPDCAMAHWGMALAHRGNPFAGAPAPGADARGLEAARRALELDPPTARERGYVDAVIALFDGHETVDWRTRGARYKAVMEEVARDHPEDVEATIFFAREITALASPADPEFRRQLHAASLMEPLFEELPRHPGLAHYLIHAYDAPALARRGLAAARAYADIAPAAPHALHMPSHIFTRLGYWEESIETNRRSAEAAGPDSGERLHAWDYMVYGYLQLGDQVRADSLVGEARALVERVGLDGRLPYNAAAMEARIALESDRWEEAAALEVRTAADGPPEAVTRFARGLGMARSGDLSGAREEGVHLARIRDALEARGEADWAERTEAQRLAVEAWILYGEGESQEALERAERAASIEERVEKHPVTPGPLLPARELHGDLLLVLGREAEARAAYEATLEREPNRARTRAALSAAGAAPAADGRDAR